mgnify:CR=1 FL=1
MPTVTFDRVWGERSWLVSHTCKNYTNSRPPHVEVIGDKSVAQGDKHQLFNCRVMGRAIVWDVVGRTNNGKQAHFTVAYYSSHQEAILHLPEYLE